MKTCPNCGRSFEAKNDLQKYCSLECALENRSKNFEPPKVEPPKIEPVKVEPEKVEKLIKVCPSCGVEFEAKRPFQKYCSHRCGGRDFYRQKSSRRELHKRTCQNCGAEFETKYGHQKFCSSKCTNAYHFRKFEEAHPHHRRKYNEPLPAINCLNCGKPFIPRNSRNKFCSPRCNRIFWARKYYSEKRIAAGKPFKSGKIVKEVERNCLNCGEKFSTTDSRRKYCSDSCRIAFSVRKLSEARKIKRREKLQEVICPNCGEKFKQKKGYQKFCSKKCAVKYHSGDPRKRVKRGCSNRICAHCGLEFKPTSNNQKYCAECSQAIIYKKRAEYNRLMKETRAAAKLKRIEADERAADERAKIAMLPVIKLPSCGDGAAPPPVKIKPKNHLELMMQQAADCGLSYGKYTAALRFGKTYEELKEKYESTLTDNFAS